MTRQLIGCFAALYLFSCAQGDLQVSGESKVKAVSSDSKRSVKDIKTDQSKKTINRGALENDSPLIREKNLLPSISFGSIRNRCENCGLIFSANEVEIYVNDEKVDTFPAVKLGVKFASTSYEMNLTLPICGRQTSLADSSCVSDDWIQDRAAKYVFVSGSRVFYRFENSESPSAVSGEVIAINQNSEGQSELTLLINGQGNLSSGRIICSKDNEESEWAVDCPNNVVIGDSMQVQLLGTDLNFSNQNEFLPTVK